MSSHMPRVNGDEGHRLRLASFYVKELISMGESFVTGEVRSPMKFGPSLQKRTEKQEQSVDKNLSVRKAQIVQ